MHKSQNPNAAFTIVELLIAASITVLIVVLLGSMFTSLASTSSKSNQRIDAFRDAQAALQMIGRDMSGLFPANSGAFFVATTSTSLYKDPNTTSLKNHQLYALSLLRNKLAGAPNLAAGDVCAVGYYCRWDTNHYTLRRYFRDSRATFGVFQAVGAGAYASMAALYQPSTSDDVVAANIWNLQIAMYKNDGTIDTDYPTNARIVTDPSTPNAILPAAIELSFDAMSTEAARTVVNVSNSPDDWMNTNSTIYKRLIGPNVYSFRTRIGFR